MAAKTESIPGKSISSHDLCLNHTSFWCPEFIENSAWIEHAPFAFWITGILKPRTFVELGTHGGYSYFAFCQVVASLGLETRCYAVDTWKGDEHAGFYGEEVFERVQAYNERHYAAFSRLVRSTFDAALGHFSDGSIDLLHIDGRHFYEDVKHDFESWRPKLSDRAVVLFHDTNVRERDFGVFRLWEELREQFPTFEFLHGHGLGVLGFGSVLPDDIRALFDASSGSRAATDVRLAYSRLGAALKTDFSQRKAHEKVTAELKKTRTLADEIGSDLKARDTEAKDLASKLNAEKARAREFEAKLKVQEARTREFKAKLKARATEVKKARKAAVALKERVKARQSQVRALKASTSWQITRPLRAVSRRLVWFRRNTRRGSKLLWWLATGQFSRATNALLPFYHRYLPLRLKTMIPNRMRQGIKRRLENSLVRIERSDLSGSPSTQETIAGSGKARDASDLSMGVKRRLAYRDLLIESLFRPQRTAPYSPRDTYFIAYMASYGKYLTKRYMDRAQSTLVSVVMPTFNRAHCIGDAIRSVLAQTYRNWELVIIDDCSSDDTSNVISSFPDARIKYLRLERNLGSAGARNAALDEISGDYVTYVDSDNTIDANFLLILFNQLEDNVDVDVVYCAQRAFKIRQDRAQEIFVRFAPFHRPSLENRNYIDIGAVMHRRSVIERFGKFNAKMQRLVDWEFILRCTVEKSAMAVPVILSNYYYQRADNQVTKVHCQDRAIKELDACIKGDAVSQSVSGIAFGGGESMFCLPYKVREPALRRPVTIVIPNFEAEHYLRASVESIHAFSGDHDVELIIVDNGSSASVVEFLNGLKDQGRAKVLFNQKNLGFSHAVNQGMEVASSPNDIVLMNNDAVVTRGWLDGLQTVVSDYPDVGLVMPRQVVPAGEKSLLIHQPHCRPSRECDVNLSAHHANVLDPMFNLTRGYMELTYAPFFCTYIPRATLDLLGMLDVENGPHYRSDRLYCDMVREVAGRRIVYTPHSKVYHFVQKATHDLKARAPHLFKDIFIKNDWKAISARRNESRAGKKEIKGHLGSIKAGHMAGWVLDLEHPEQHFEVEILADGQVVASGETNLFHEGLQDMGLPANHGFKLKLDEPVFDGKSHRFVMRVRGMKLPIFGCTSRTLVTPVACSLKPWLAGPGDTPTEVGGRIEESRMGEAEPEILEVVETARGQLRRGDVTAGIKLLQSSIQKFPDLVLCDLGILDALRKGGVKPISFEKAMERRHNLWFGSEPCSDFGSKCCKRNVGGDAVNPKCPHWQRAFASKRYMVRRAEEAGLRTPEIIADVSDPEALDFVNLPDKYVLKPDGLHSAKGVFVMSEGVELLSGYRVSIDQVKDRMKELKKLKPSTRFHVEELVRQRGADDLPVVPLDYKIHVFGGRAQLIEVFDRNASGHNRRCYSRDWSALQYPLATRHPFGRTCSVPETLPTLIANAEKLGDLAGCYVRIDLYDGAEDVVFGEVTVTPQNGKNFTHMGQILMTQLWTIYESNRV